MKPCKKPCLQSVPIRLCPHPVREHLVVDAKVRVATGVVRVLGLAAAFRNHSDLVGLKVFAEIIVYLTQSSKIAIDTY